jgi:hypothetical protein
VDDLAPMGCPNPSPCEARTAAGPGSKHFCFADHPDLTPRSCLAVSDRWKVGSDPKYTVSSFYARRPASASSAMSDFIESQYSWTNIGSSLQSFAKLGTPARWTLLAS